MFEPFSVLLPVCDNDDPTYLRRSFCSTVEAQTLRPNEVVIVRDGPLRPELDQAVKQLCADSPVHVTVVTLPVNGGLGPALDAGLAASKHDVVARMDADDVSVPHRFEVQLPLIQDADVVGAGLLEFTDDTDQIVGRRVPPTDPADIRRYARLHDPFNHPTVVYRRQSVQAVGGYGGQVPLMEDYLLFTRMLANGAKPANVAEPLVYYRVGAGAYRRRGGRTLLRSELMLQRELHAAGFTSTWEYLRNVSVRGTYRLVPWRLRRALYRRVVATRFDNQVVPPELGSRAGAGRATAPERSTGG